MKLKNNIIKSQEEIFTQMNKGGYVYLVFSKGRSKIGFSKDPEKRLEKIQTSSPFDVLVMCVRYFYNARKIETLLHRHYKDFRVKGEWFDLTGEQVFEICDILELGWYLDVSEKLEKSAKSAAFLSL